MMRSVAMVLAGLTVALAAVTAAQQLPPPFPRTNATRLFMNDALNVWDIVWPKGQPTALHRHIYDQVGTYYERGGRTITTPEGQARSTMTEVGGLSTTRKGTTHIEEGNTDPPLRAVFVELKRNAPSGLPPVDVGTPALPRPGASKVLDDERVTAWDTPWPASTQGFEYRASFETVVVWLGEGTLRTTVNGRSTETPVKAGTMRHLDRGAPDVLAMTSGSPRTLIFQFK